jgi:GTPase SAR1 family protein
MIGKTTFCASYTTDGVIENGVKEALQWVRWVRKQVDDFDSDVFVATVYALNPMLRSIAYNATDLFVICYAIDNPASLDSAVKSWFTETQAFNNKVPCALIGLKKDKRDSCIEAGDTVENLVTVEQGIAVAARMNAIYFAECCSTDKQSVAAMFSTMLSLTRSGPNFRKLQKQWSQQSCELL